MTPAFTDQELGFIHTIMLRADPLKMINEAQSVREKIEAYVRAEREAQKEPKT